MKLAGKKRSTIMDYGTTVLATGMIQAFGVITGILTARLLGPAGKGDLTTVFWLPGLMTEAGIVALPQAIAFAVSRNPERNASFTAAGFWIALNLGLLEMVMLYPLVPWILGSDKQHLVTISRWFLLYLPVVFASLTLLGIDQGRQAFRRYNFLRLLPSVLYVVGMLSLWRVGRVGVTEFVLANLFAHIVTLVIRSGASGKSLFPPSFTSCLRDSALVIKRGLIFHLPSLAGILLMRADIFLLIRMVSPENIGYYTVAMSIALVQLGITSSLIQVNFPKVAALNLQRAADTMLRQFRVAQMPIIGMALFVELVSPWIVRYIFGKAFLPAVMPAFVLIIALAIWGLSQLLDNGFRAMGHVMPGVISSCAGLIVLLITGLFLTRQIGIIGMAVGVLCGQLIVFSSLLLACRRLLLASWAELWGLNKNSISVIFSKLLMRQY